MRLKNQGLQQTKPYFGYLTCAQPDLCGFTYDDAVAGNTTFRIAVEQCAAGTANCDTNATCTNTPAGAVCACNPRFAGNGNTCAPIDACLGDNGGCAQGCATAPDDTAVCTCAPGFVLAPDQKACTPRAENRLYNTGLGLSLLLPKALDDFWAPAGSNVHMALLGSATDVFTFTVHAPGTSYRLCVHESGGYRAFGLSWIPPAPAPDGWDSTDCGWFVTDAGNGQVRLRSARPDVIGNGYGYLHCLDATQCLFNTEAQGTAGNTLFAIDQDECAANATTCDAFANCTDSVPGYDCACSAGYTGDGRSCVLTDVCAIDNGGCSQRCVGTAADGSGICACYGGSALNADQQSCDPVDGGRLYGVGLAKFIAANPSFPQPAFRFIFNALGDDITVRPASTGPAGSKTIDMDDGTNTYRLCMVNVAGFELGVELSSGPNWNLARCAWLIEDVGNNQVRLVNVAVEATNPGLHLDCGNAQACGFSSSTGATTRFVLDVDECAAQTDTCDPNANCTNTVGSFTCACASGYVGNGTTCVLVDPCVVSNGDCSQRCTNDAPGQRVCGCYPGFRLGANGRSCEPAPRMRLLNEGVGYLDLGSNDYVFASPTGRTVAVDQVPGFHDRFTLTMASTPGYCANGSRNIFCPNLERICIPAVVGGTLSLDPVIRDARVGDPANWNAPECTWIFEPVDDDSFRMKNLWLQQTAAMAHHDYLYCGGPNACEFTQDESTLGNTLFTLDVDDCAVDSGGCDANATCTDTLEGGVCTCNGGYAGSGQLCALENVCVVNNGGCQQQCLGTTAGMAVCGCAPGFALNADGRSCDARPALRLFNVGVGKYLDHQRGAGIGQLIFSPEGRTIRMEQSLDGPDTFTFTVEVKPGTCANGSTRDQCPNLYRLCAQDNSGFRWKTEQLSDYGRGKPALWDAPECKWRVEDLGDGMVRLRNLWLEQRHPYLSNLICTGDGNDCYFNYGTDTSAYATFAIYTDECSASAPVCDTQATCRNIAGVDTCVCNADWSGDGTSCAPNNGCVVGNGGCQQTCTPNGDTASCACWAGLDPGPGDTCVPWPDVRLVSGAFGLKASWSVASGLRFDTVGKPMHVEASGMTANAVTLTLDVGADGEVRICGGQPSGFSWVALRRPAGAPAPAGWDSVECTWLVEGADGGAVHLRNLWIEQNYSQFDYFECWNSANCGFTYLDEETPQSVFYLQSDECAAANVCGSNATCTNTASSHTCTCNPGYAGD